MVIEVLPIGYLPPPSKGKGKTSEIRYTGGSKYLRAAMRYVEAVGLAELSPRRLKPLLLVMDLPPASKSGVPTSSRLMLFLFPRWSASLRRPLRMVFAFLCTSS